MAILLEGRVLSGFLGPTKPYFRLRWSLYFQAGAIIIPGIYPDVIHIRLD